MTLKGGTAINLFLSKILRSSIDIDFDFTGELEKEKMLAVRELIIRELKRIGASIGYSIIRKPASSNYIIERIFFQYQPLQKINEKIKIEINFIDRAPLLSRSLKKCYNIYSDTIDDFNFYTYSIEEIIAQKTEAFLDREFVRDLYDILSLIDSVEKLDESIVKKAIILRICMSNKASLKSNFEIDNFQKFLQQFIELIDNKTQKEFNSELRYYISSKTPYDWEQMKKNVRNFYLKILQLNEQEKLFWNLFFQNNQFKPDLIIADMPEFNKNVYRHPAILRQINSNSK